MADDEALAAPALAFFDAADAEDADGLAGDFDAVAAAALPPREYLDAALMISTSSSLSMSFTVLEEAAAADAEDDSEVAEDAAEGAKNLEVTVGFATTAVLAKKSAGAIGVMTGAGIDAIGCTVRFGGDTTAAADLLAAAAGGGDATNALALLAAFCVATSST